MCHSPITPAVNCITARSRGFEQMRKTTRALPLTPLTVFRRRAGPGREACGERGRARSRLSLFSPVCEKHESGRREEAPALRTRHRAIGPGRPLRRERRWAPPASPEHPLLGSVKESDLRWIARRWRWTAPPA
jgi:hypothetical protein